MKNSSALVTDELVTLKRQKADVDSNLAICTNSRQFGCALDTEACKQLSTSLDLCTRSFSAKNVSFQNLQSAHDELVDDWENVTATLDQCTDDSTKLAEKLEAESKLVISLRQQVLDQKEDHDGKLQTCEEKAGSMRAVIESVQDNLKCLDTSKNCSFEAGKYWCLPRFFTRSLCLSEAQTGHEIFGVSVCELLGDLTVANLNWRRFVKNNPLISVFFIFTLIFAIIGFISSTILITWCVVKYRRRRRSSSYDLTKVKF